MTCFDFALTYAELSWSIFPAPPGTKQSYKSEKDNGRKWGQTKDFEEICRYWEQYPLANIGIPTGKGNGFFVVEIDTPSGHDVDGFASLAQLEQEHGQLPETLQAVSPSGSIHYYFKYPSDIEIRNTTSQLAPGIDTRGAGGMVIAPPSIKPGKGVYRWKILAPIVDAPDWLLRLLTKTRYTEQPSMPLNLPDTPNIEKIKKALSVVAAGFQNGRLDKNNRTYWLAILCGLYNELGHAGFAFADDFSSSDAGKYGGRMQLKQQWDSIALAGGYGWTIGTLFWLANQVEPHWNEKQRKGGSNDQSWRYGY